ncbi:MAG: hypothetical protein ACLGIA_08855 [Actinomycetes bacterium]
MSRPKEGSPETGPAARDETRRSGPGRVLIAAYGVFALSASARAGVQIATHFSAAPVAYSLSAFAALVYVVATAALATRGRAAWRVAVAAVLVELAGVLMVGTLSLTDRAAFPDATVWSVYGRGYGVVPLVLPVLGLLWLRHTAPARLGARSPSAGG